MAGRRVVLEARGMSEQACRHWDGLPEIERIRRILFTRNVTMEGSRLLNNGEKVSTHSGLNAAIVVDRQPFEGLSTLPVPTRARHRAICRRDGNAKPENYFGM